MIIKKYNISYKELKTQIIYYTGYYSFEQTISILSADYRLKNSLSAKETEILKKEIEEYAIKEGLNEIQK